MDSLVLTRIDNLIRLLEVVVWWLPAPSLCEPVSMRPWRGVLDSIRNEAKRYIRTLEHGRAALERGARTERETWHLYEQVLSRSASTFRECLELLGGRTLKALVKPYRIGAIYRLSDALIMELAYNLITPDSFAIPGPEETVASTIKGIPRVRFPEWTLWTLPLVAYEYAYVAMDGPTLLRLPEAFATRLPGWSTTGDKDGLRLRARVLLADSLATYTLGPSYACAAITYRLRPSATFRLSDELAQRCVTCPSGDLLAGDINDLRLGDALIPGDEKALSARPMATMSTSMGSADLATATRPSDIDRAAMILGLLKSYGTRTTAGDRIEPPFVKVHDELRRRWTSELSAIGTAPSGMTEPTPPLDPPLVLHLLETSLIGGDKSLRPAAWNRAQSDAKELWRQLADVASELTFPSSDKWPRQLRDVLNSAWYARLGLTGSGQALPGLDEPLPLSSIGSRSIERLEDAATSYCLRLVPSPCAASRQPSPQTPLRTRASGEVKWVCDVERDSGDRDATREDVAAVREAAPDKIRHITAVALAQTAPHEIKREVTRTLEGLEASPRIQHRAARLLQQGLSAYEARDLTLAKEQLERALRLEPGHPSAERWLGEVLRMQGENQAAIVHLDLALAALSPEPAAEQAWALATRGQVLNELGRYDDAELSLREALRRDRTLYWAQAELGESLRFKGRYEEAVTILREAFEGDPCDARAGGALGASLAALGASLAEPELCKEAVHVLRQVNYLRPDDPWTLAVLAQTLDLLDGPLDGVTKAYEVAYEAGAKDARTSRRLADIRALQGRLQDAEQLWREVVDGRAPHVAGDQSDVGWCLMRLGEHEAAAVAFARAAATNPARIEGLFDLGLVFLLWGRTQKAVDYYSEAIRRLLGVPGLGRRRFLLGVARRDLDWVICDPRVAVDGYALSTLLTELAGAYEKL